MKRHRDGTALAPAIVLEGVEYTDEKRRFLCIVLLQSIWLILADGGELSCSEGVHAILSRSVHEFILNRIPAVGQPFAAPAAAEQAELVALLDATAAYRARLFLNLVQPVRADDTAPPAGEPAANFANAEEATNAGTG